MSELGTITRVQTNERGNPILVDVNLSYTREKEEIIYRSPARGVWFVPQVGDTVEVTKIGAGQYVAHSPIQSPPFPLPDDASAGDVIVKTDANTTLRVDNDGAITIETGGDINFSASNIYIDGKRLATEDHVHDYDDDGTTKQTDTPNDGLT